jgi:hypothetical protein
MYRIRLANREEAVYKSADELAQAVRMGIVSPDAEVFHNAAHRWLPIELHPDYRAVVSGKRPSLPVDRIGPHSAQVQPAPPPLILEPPRQHMTPPVPAPVPVQGLVHEAQDSVARVPQAVEPPWVAVGDRSGLPPLFRQRSGSGRRRQAAAAGLPVVAVVAIAVGLIWRTVLPGLERRLAASQLSEGMPEPPPVELTPRTYLDTAYPAPSAPLPLETEVDSGLPPGTTRTSRLRATLSRGPSYFEAYAEARAEMEEAFDYINFRRVFDPSRFASTDSLRATRRMVAAAGNILRVYRGREVMLEQSYRPDDPGGPGTLREPFEVAVATGALLGDVDSLFGVLLSQQGRFTYDGVAIRFQDRHAAAVYTDLRARVATPVRTWRDSTAAHNLVTMPRLVRALREFTAPPAR